MRFGTFIFIIVFTGAICHGDDNQESLKPVNTSKPIYQVKDGYPSMPITWPIPGGLDKRRLPDPVTMAEFKETLEKERLRHKQELQQRESELKLNQHKKEMYFGGILKIGGWCLLILAGIAHCATNISIIKNYATVLFFGGVGGISAGMAIQKTVEFDQVGTVAFIVCIIGVVMILARRWSLSKLPGISHVVAKAKRKMHDYKMDAIE